jgi:hypothetical protein
MDSTERRDTTPPRTGSTDPDRPREATDSSLQSGLPGTAEPFPDLLIDRSTPDLPELYGALLARAQELDVAAWRIRLAGLHLPAPLMLGLDRIRVIVGELDGQRLATEAEGLILRPNRAGTVRALLHLLLEDRLLVRSAPLGGWAPDFSVFHGSDGSVTLVAGPHWLERPFPHRGPALTSVHTGPRVGLVVNRFEELWQDAHDVKAAVLRMLIEAARRGEEAGAPSKTQRS